jgi:predicted enzyme related to lactoylglutathione lyase
VTRVVRFEIHTDDPEAVRPFHVNVFGWKIQKWEGGPVEYWTVTTGSDDQLGINGGMLRPRKGQSPGTVNTVAVESLRAGVAVNEALDKIQEQGGCVPVTSFHRRKAW